MGRIVNSDQLIQRDLRILLRGGKPGVSQQLLDRSQIGSIAQQMRRESMAQSVRMNGRIARNASRVELHDVARAAIASGACPR